MSSWILVPRVLLLALVSTVLTYASNSATNGAASHSAANNAPSSNGWFAPKGNCISDDTAALQSLLDLGTWIVLDRPIGGCYLVSKTLILRPGDYLFGTSANNPNISDQSHGVVIRLKPNSNVPILRVYDALEAQGGGNEFMGIENVVFDGNGSQQSQEMGPNDALVDYRGTFIQTALRHVLIINSFGTALFTGSTELDNVWIFGTSTSSYAWINNPGKPGLGALSANQVYVEETTKPGSGGYQSSFPTAVNDPGTYAHAIWINGLSSGTFSQIHCESAATCIDFNGVQSLTIHGISGSRIGNPSSEDPSDQYLMRALDLNIDNFVFSAANFDQSGTSYQGSFSGSRVFGLKPGLDTTDVYETPTGKATWPFYCWGRWDQGYSGVPYLGERPIVSNELWIEKKGNYSPNKLAIWDEKGGPNGSYAFFERNGPQLNLGLSQGPWDWQEDNMLQMNFYGFQNPANNVQIPEGRLGTGQLTNTDMAGEVSLQSALEQDIPFSGIYNVHPECSVAPQFDLGEGNHFWISYAGASSFTIHVSRPVQGAFSYTCVGRR
jgi:hypothetical protein